MANCIKVGVNIVLLLFTYFGFSQNTFSKRLNVANKENTATTLKIFDDTLFIPTWITETAPDGYSACLLKVTKNGSIITQKRFKPPNINYSGGNSLYIKNRKFYTTSITDYANKLKVGLYVYNQSCDTILTKSYGDTTYLRKDKQCVKIKTFML